MTVRSHRVRIHWPDGRTHDDQVRGRTADEALANATANWITETSHGRADRIEHLPILDGHRAELGDLEPEPGDTT